jgi:hypothetical protein
MPLGEYSLINRSELKLIKILRPTFSFIKFYSYLVRESRFRQAL